MIDYDKLKLAHELSLKADRATKHIVDISTFRGDRVDKFYLTYLQEDTECDDLDDLISKLHELIKPKPISKYRIGQEVWRIEDDEPYSFIIKAIDYENDEMYLEGEEHGWWLEEQIHPSRAELIDEQIEQWTDLKNFDKKYKKPIVGLFGNDTQNQIHKEMMDSIYDRLLKIEQAIFGSCYIKKEEFWVPLKYQECNDTNTEEPPINSERQCEKCKQLVFGQYGCPCDSLPTLPEDFVKKVFNHYAKEKNTQCNHTNKGEIHHMTQAIPYYKCLMCGEIYS